MSTSDDLPPGSVSELLELALETAGLSVWEWDVRSGQIRQKVSSALDLGYGPGIAPQTLEAWLGKVHEEDRLAAGDAVSRCLMGDEPQFRARLRVRDFAGHYRWLQLGGRVAARDERGTAVRFIGTTQDVHHLQTIEDAVRRDAELFNHIPDCIFCLDGLGVVTYWSAGACALYGWTPDEVVGRPITARLPAGPSPARDVFERLGVRADLNAEFLDHRKDGSKVWVEARFARFSNGRGAVGTLCFARDVSRRREEQELLLRDASILSQLSDLVVCLDLEGSVTYWNDAAERVLGWKREEILGKHVSVRVPRAYAELLEVGLSQLRQGKAPPAAEWQDFRKDGSPVWILWRTEPLRDRGGKPFAVAAIGTDMTERRSAEEQRSKLEAQLFHAQKLDSLGAMVGGIAHDFSNTLAIVLVYAELALAHEAKLPEDVREALRQIHLAGGRARDLVARLLTFGRTQKPQRGVVELRAMLHDYTKLLRATFPSTIELELVAPEPLTVFVDENQLHQVLLNLSTNAAHAMHDRGSLTLRLSRERVVEGEAAAELGLPPGDYAKVSVEDRGEGMSAETLSRIFEPFFTTKPPGLGTGLGLATALAIAKGHGGSLVARSELGRGACFTLYLPLGSEQPTESLVQSLAPVGRGERVLIVDDEEAVAVLTRAALLALGYEAECVGTPERFIERYLDEPLRWDLLVIDQTMPRATGLELATRIRAAGHRTPIVLTSGFNRQLTPGSLESVGRARLLKKPFDLAELGHVVASALASGADSVQPPK
jgi:PAS domain S-box-containing protein